MKPTLMLHGQFQTLSSFALVNRRLSAGLKNLDYRMIEMPSDGAVKTLPPLTEPDIYLAHDHPFDIVDAPGKFNVFFLEYDYARILKQDALLVERLNHFFDLLLVPSEFVREVCEKSDIHIPIAICPLGFDPLEFHPNVPPRALPTTKQFKFLYLGGANERKGSDLLLRAYSNEFRNTDDVVLVLKTFGYEHLRAEFETRLARVRRRRNAPEIIYEHSADESIAGYYTAVDCGVFPFRGEGFALPILEAIASGCPVIVTNGGGPRDYCNKNNAQFIPAKQKSQQGKIKYAPDVSQLQALMRKAYERGAPAAVRRTQISHTVAGWTWQRTTERIDAALQAVKPQPTLRNAKHTAVSYAFLEDGDTSWRLESGLLDRALARHFEYTSLPFRAAPLATPTDIVFAESGHALEHFFRAKRLNPSVVRILRRNNGPFANMVAIEDRERALCGVPRKPFEPLAYWRNAAEFALADQIIVAGKAARDFFLQANYPPEKLRVIPSGVREPQTVPPRRARTLRFLYIATEPFRKGVRLLFEAWDTCKPRDAELVCIVNTEILKSALLLRYLVRNPNIQVKSLMPRRELEQEYLECDCLVLPSLEEGFAIAIAEGMALGKPAIVSTATGTNDVIKHLGNGYIVPTGSATKLAQALEYFCTHRDSVRRMGAAAQDTMRDYSNARYHRAIIGVLESYLPHA